jgi:hypothetical protein
MPSGAGLRIPGPLVDARPLNSGVIQSPPAQKPDFFLMLQSAEANRIRPWGTPPRDAVHQLVFQRSYFANCSAVIVPSTARAPMRKDAARPMAVNTIVCCEKLPLPFSATM